MTSNRQCAEGIIKIKFSDGRIKECLSKGEVVNIGDSYYIECPDVQDFCKKFKKRCPMDCSGNGICLGGGRCFCFGKNKNLDCVRLS